MKKTAIIASLLLATLGMKAQESETAKYDKWSIELAGGMNKPSSYFTKDYYTNTPSKWNAELGIRYMMNDKFGLKLDGGYYHIESAEGSKEFESKYYRVGLQGVINAGSVLGFRDWTNTFGLLLHGGAGMAILTPAGKSIYAEKNDNMGYLITGITPQIKISNSIVLTGDISTITNFGQKYAWDGNSKVEENAINGFMMTASVGLTFYLGGAEKHADWVSEKSQYMDELEKTNKRISIIEEAMQDTDQDGVPNYLDREPNTINGVAVNTKGIAIDTNRNGIPDELEATLERRFQMLENNNTGNASSTIADLINKGYVNLYFKFNSSSPQTYSLEAANYLIKYMKENTEATAELIGYSDEIGPKAYNDKLSEQRAKKVYDLLIAAGIKAERLSYKGGGVDSSVDKNSANARQLVRRVTFKLK